MYLYHKNDNGQYDYELELVVNVVAGALALFGAA